MSKIVSLVEPQTREVTYNVFKEGDAQKLADLYLPVRLRDFYVNLHPIVQCYLYERASVPEEFFVLVDQEYARFGHYHRVRKDDREWHFKPTVVKHTENLTLPGPLDTAPRLG